MRHSTTVGEALRVLMLHLNVHDRLAFPLMLRMESGNVFLGYSVQHPEKEGTPQIYDAAISIAFKIMRELCGPEWEPRFVQFSHHEPESRTSYRRVFGPRLLFDAEWSGISFSEAWLDQLIPGADAARCGQLSQDLLAAQTVNPHSFRDEVQCVLHRLLLSGTTDAASVARLFGISERALRHRLQLEGSTMRELLTEVRFDLSRHLLQSTQLSMSKIAASLCYSDAAVFSRAFRGWAGVSPRKWRAAQTAG
jgi:AraC-like DNA-binding protein